MNDDVRGLPAGVSVPLIPALTREGKLDLSSITRTLRWHEEQGATGVWVNGTMGELAGLSEEEHRTVLEHSVQTTTLPITAHVGANSTRIARDRAQHAADAGAAAVSVITPYYLTVTVAELRAHLEAVRSRTKLPLLLYFYPTLTGMNLTANNIIDLARDGVIDGMKDSSGDLLRLSAITSVLSEEGVRFAAYGGASEGVGLARIVGCRGVVPGIANLLPSSAATVWRDPTGEDAAAAQRDIRRVLEITRSTHRPAAGTASNAIFRYLLHQLALFDDPTPLPPTLPVTREQARQLQPAVELLRRATTVKESA